MSPRLLAALLTAALAGPARAEPLTAGGCGGDAYSSATVTEGRPPRKCPLTAMPQTLCADVDGPRPNVDIQIYGIPGVGSGDGQAPYEGSPRRGMGRPLDR